MGKFREMLEKERINVNSEKEIMKDLFKNTERWGTLMGAKAIVYKGGVLLKGIGKEEHEFLDESMDYYEYFKEMCIKWAERNDKEFENLKERNESLEKVLEIQNCMLRDISGDIGSLRRELDQANKKLDALSKPAGKEKKAE